MITTYHEGAINVLFIPMNLTINEKEKRAIFWFNQANSKKIHIVCQRSNDQLNASMGCNLDYQSILNYSSFNLKKDEEKIKNYALLGNQQASLILQNKYCSMNDKNCIKWMAISAENNNKISQYKLGRFLLDKLTIE